MPKQRGGLGILDLECFNTALVAKWWWTIQSETECPWARLILHFHLTNGYTRSYSMPNRQGKSPLWKGIYKTLGAFNLGMRTTCGNGIDTLFWKDLWIGEQVLDMAFPSIYEISTQQNATVAEIYQNKTWNLEFRHFLSTSRTIALGSLLNLLNSYSWADKRDKKFWALHPSGVYTVKSMYEKLKEGPQSTGVGKYIWTTAAPLKTKVNLWLASRGALLTADVLQKRNIAASFCCPLCKMQDETANHLFLSCNVTKNIWEFFCGVFKLPPVPPDLNKILTTWRRRKISANIAPKWDCTVAILIWCVWAERNARIFQGKSTETILIIAKIMAMAVAALGARLS